MPPASRCRREQPLTQEPDLGHTLLAGDIEQLQAAVTQLERIGGVAQHAVIDGRELLLAAAEAEWTSGFRLSTGVVSDLERRFLVYLRALHEERSGGLCKVLEKDGG